MVQESPPILSFACVDCGQRIGEGHKRCLIHEERHRVWLHSLRTDKNLDPKLTAFELALIQKIAGGMQLRDVAEAWKVRMTDLARTMEVICARLNLRPELCFHTVRLRLAIPERYR